jgi:hypothetical protein
MFRIGEFAQIAQVSARQLRFYDQLGLLRPEHIDRQTGLPLLRDPPAAASQRHPGAEGSWPDTGADSSPMVPPCPQSPAQPKVRACEMDVRSWVDSSHSANSTLTWRAFYFLRAALY